MLNGLFWRMNSGMEVNRILRMRQRRVAVSFNTPGRRELRRGAGGRDRCLEEEESSVQLILKTAALFSRVKPLTFTVRCSSILHQVQSLALSLRREILQKAVVIQVGARHRAKSENIHNLRCHGQNPTRNFCRMALQLNSNNHLA